MRMKSHNLSELQEYRNYWSDLQIEFWEEEQKSIYIRRKKAVDMYIDNYSTNEIESETGIKSGNLTKLVSRCLKINSDTGRQYGYAGLIPNRQLTSRTINQGSTKNKAVFTKLLLEYPELEMYIRDSYFNRNKKILEKNVTNENLYRRFLEECKRLGITDYDYPFNTDDKARRTFYRYLKQLDNENSNEAIRRESSNANQKYHSTGIGDKVREYPLVPFSVVQIDGHRIDMLYGVEVTNKHGESIMMPATRAWLIAVIDVATRVILGYAITSNENYDHTDVLRAIRNSIIPRSPMSFTISGIQYPENYGFHSLAIPETEWAMPEVIMLDNAKSHLANNLTSKLCDKIYCSLNFGPVASPTRRGIIERFFNTLETNGFHRMPSTTGSNPDDLKRKTPEKDVRKYKITYSDLVQLTEYFIATYNNSPHSSLDNETPLNCMKRRIVGGGMCPCIASAELKKVVYELTNIVEEKTVRGEKKSGRHPYINYKNVEYRNDILSQSFGLVGEKITIEVNPDDISSIKGYFSDGTELGILKAVGEWGRVSHSLKTREDALRLARYNKKNGKSVAISLTELEKELQSRSQKETRARTKMSRIQKEQKTNKPSDAVEKTNSNDPQLLGSFDMMSKGYETVTKTKLELFSESEKNAILNANSLEEIYKHGFK